MTHWMGVIIVKPPTVGNSIAQQLEKMLAPFDSDPPEGTEPLRKKEVCYCCRHDLGNDSRQFAVEKLGYKSWKELSDAADAEKPVNPYVKELFGGHATKEIKRKYWEFDQEDLKNRWWRNYYYPFKFYEHQYLVSHAIPSKQYPLKPREGCDECNGTGYAMMNIGKWDFWEIGGRYDGEILMAPREHDDDDVELFGREYYKQKYESRLLENNLIAVDGIAPEFVACSILGPDGVFFDRDTDFEKDYAFGLGIDAYTDPDSLENAWTELFQSRLAKWRGRNLLAVGIDYHN